MNQGLISLAVCLLFVLASADPREVSLVNVASEAVEIFWENPGDGSLVSVGTLDPGEGSTIDSHVGHSFSYTVDGETQSVTVTEDDEEQAFVIGPTRFGVTCTTTEGEIHATILPEWAPFGAARFLQLVREEYFDGCALNRVVPQFLTQFGIGANYKQRTSYRSDSIPDDIPRNIPFKPGYLSYAGSGEDSRTAEVFVVMPGTPEEQLEYFGVNSWETPFGFVDMEDVENVVGKWHAYGDMPPWGEGPDPQLIYREDGYDYLRQRFPKMSYIEKCTVTELGDEDEEEL